jgi:glutaredoxin 3
MNFAYYRKSKYSKEESLNKLKENAKNATMDILSEVEITESNAVLVNLCNKKWLQSVLTHDKNLVGLLPCSAIVLEKDGTVYVGTSNPAVLGGVTDKTEIQKLAAEAEVVMRKLINDTSGAGELKPTKVKLFSTQTCPYCKMEKEWLEANKVEHEVVYVDQNQVEAQRMVQETGQMGVPVTEIQYDEGESEYIVGFNKPALGKVLGF